MANTDEQYLNNVDDYISRRLFDSQPTPSQTTDRINQLSSRLEPEMLPIGQLSVSDGPASTVSLNRQHSTGPLHGQNHLLERPPSSQPLINEDIPANPFRRRRMDVARNNAQLQPPTLLHVAPATQSLTTSTNSRSLFRANRNEIVSHHRRGQQNRPGPTQRTFTTEQNMYERNLQSHQNVINNFLQPTQHPLHSQTMNDMDAVLEVGRREQIRRNCGNNLHRFWEQETEEVGDNSTWVSDSMTHLEFGTSTQIGGEAPRHVSTEQFDFGDANETILAAAADIRREIIPVTIRRALPPTAVQRPSPRSRPLTPSQPPIEEPIAFRRMRDLPDLTTIDDELDVWGIQDTRRMPRTNRSQSGSSDAVDKLSAERIRELISLSPNISHLTDEEKEKIVWDFSIGPPHLKYKSTYPFFAEGILQKDQHSHNQLRVFSSRLGKVIIPDHPKRQNIDYVYFLVVAEGQYDGFCFSTHDANLVSTKFPSENVIEVKGYAIMAHAIGDRSCSGTESAWICYNDQLGMMRVASGAARTSMKKMPVWEKQLDIVSVHARFENKRFYVKTLIALTNNEEKKAHFPKDPFLIQDAVLTEKAGEDYVFYSQYLDLRAVLKSTLVGFEIQKNRKYQIVAAPTFPLSMHIQFRVILLIENESFWHKKEWIREKLVERMEEYKKDSNIRNGQLVEIQPTGSVFQKSSRS